MPSFIALLARTLRIHQWVKNVLVFLPAAMAHRLLEPQLWPALLSAAAAFCFASSFVYVCNDILDRESDRQHRSKKNRPIASGALSVQAAVILAVVMALASSLCALQLPSKFSVLLVAYVLISSTYSVVIKRLIAADIVVLASLYALRVLAGAEAVSVHVSQWLLLFSMFFFLSLACMKRFSELRVLRQASASAAQGRGYRVDDLELISQSGCAAGYLSVLVLAMYVSSREVTALYVMPQLIYLLCPLLLFWITRVWLLAHRGEVHDDPIIFALTDPVSYGVGCVSVGILALAI